MALGGHGVEIIPISAWHATTLKFTTLATAVKKAILVSLGRDPGRLGTGNPAPCNQLLFCCKTCCARSSVLPGCRGWEEFVHVGDERNELGAGEGAFLIEDRDF